MSFSKCITSCFGFNPDESWKSKKNVLSHWFIHILFYFSLRNYSLKKINHLLWLKAEVRVLQWLHSNFSNQTAFSQLLLIGLLSFLFPAAWVHGDPRRVAYPTDSQGHFCGQKGTPNEWVWPPLLCLILLFKLYPRNHFCINLTRLLHKVEIHKGRLPSPTCLETVYKQLESFVLYDLRRHNWAAFY